jgi:hypothetical protein
MILVIEDPGDRNVPPAEGERRMGRMLDYSADLARRGLLVRSDSLAGQAGGVRISKRSGQTAVVDGPFAEAKEIVGGFFLLSTDDRGTALAAAEQCPAAEWSTIELRHVAACYEPG